ncbi:MAG: hypothetical protein M3178_08775 [Pseudomonadota bacterium]|nr:hypothetical protein [Pseudomonadota bacterium]
MHEFTDEAERARHELTRIGERDHFAVGIELRQKETIGEHLREGVGEFTERKFVKDLIAKNLIQAPKTALRVLICLPPQFAIEKIAQKMAAGGECQRELLRAADAFRRGGKEAAQQVRDRLDPILA